MAYKNAEFQIQLEERTKNFSLNLIKTVVRLPKTSTNEILIKQVVRSGTSIGANYREACEAESGKDFVHKIRISKKEAKESAYWLELLSMSNKSFAGVLGQLRNEVDEFVKIFSSISSKFET